MARHVQIVGSFLSPYVRKVLVVMNEKGLDYEIDPIIPFMGDDRFSSISPIRRIPVFLDGDVTISDSSVICEYLDEKYPDPPMFPSTPAERAHARWLEEYADTRMGDVLIWQLFNQVAINPFVWGEPTDQEALRHTLEEEVPRVLDYLESNLPAGGFLFDRLCVADIAVASPFRNAAFAGFAIDSQRWPRSASFVERVLGLTSFAKLAPFEDKSIRTPPDRHREVLAELGAPLSADTYGSDRPRRGMMRV
jgi:glutathione S-transferase